MVMTRPRVLGVYCPFKSRRKPEHACTQVCVTLSAVSGSTGELETAKDSVASYTRGKCAKKCSILQNIVTSVVVDCN